MNKVGRPIKYTDHFTRLEIRRKQNRNNQRRCRGRKKLFRELKIFPKSKEQVDKEYQDSIIKFQNQFDYDYFFTGTIDLNRIEKEQLKRHNEQVQKNNQEFEIELGLKIDKRIGINSMRRYTEKYLQHLYNRNLFDYCFVVFELGKNRKYHTHILFKSNSSKINFDLSSENSWLIGNSLTVPITTQKDKENILSYSVKELKPSSSKITDMNKVDNWFIWGDFSVNKTKFKNPVGQQNFHTHSVLTDL